MDYRITDYQNTIYNSILGEDAKGFIDTKDFENLKLNCYTGYVLKGMAYRPDLIADYYLGSSKYAWTLYIVNNFINGIRDFTEGRKLNIPNLNAL